MDPHLERLVWNRAGGCCEYCRVPYWADELTFHIDHIIAEQHRGKTVAGNLALACYSCNLHKGPNIAGRDPKTGIVRLFHPRRHEWKSPFRVEGCLFGREDCHWSCYNRNPGNQLAASD